MLCIIVPRPDRKTMYGKLFCSSAQLEEASAKGDYEKNNPLKKKTPGAADELACLPRMNRPPPIPPRLHQYIFERKKLVLTHGEKGKSGFTGDYGHIDPDAAASEVMTHMEAEAKNVLGFGGQGSGAENLTGMSADDGGLRLTVLGVDAFVTDPAVDQLAAQDLRDRLQDFRAPGQILRKDTVRDFEDTLRDLSDTEKQIDAARAELGATLDHSSAIIDRLHKMNKDDGVVMADLYEHDILDGNELLAQTIASGELRNTQFARDAAEQAKTKKQAAATAKAQANASKRRGSIFDRLAGQETATTSRKHGGGRCR